jgi:tetratricopeptide (TPR) repeat protein
MRRFLLLLSLALAASASVVQSQSPPSTSGQDVPVVQPEQKPAEAPPENKPDQSPEKSDQKKPSKVKRKLRGALPDCVNIIFSKCWSSEARQQQAEAQAAEQRAEAAKRCEAIEAARRSRRPSESPSDAVPPGESSSKSALSMAASPTACTPEDVLEAEHDVDVGDTYAETGNKKAAEMRYRDALKALPEDPVATLHLARLLEKQGRNAEALELYRSFMTWSPTGKEAEEAHNAITKLSVGN